VIFEMKNSLLKTLLVIIISIIAIGILVDFLFWENTFEFISQNIPTGYSQAVPYKWMKGFGYIPLLWRGRFERIYFRDYKNPTRPDIQKDNILFEFTGHDFIVVDLSQAGNTFYGEWSATPAALDYIKEKREGWEQIAQPFGTYCEVFVDINYKANALLLVLFGEDRVYCRQFVCKIGGGNCGGGFVTLYWP